MDTKELGDLSPTNFYGKVDKQNMDRKNNSKLVGDEGERIACEYLVEKGYKILGKNYRISFGEIDIIAKKKFLFSKNHNVIHFIEVKTLLRSAHQGKLDEDFFPEERVDYKKQRKLNQLSQIWLEKNRFKQDHPYQIDIIGILINKETRNAKVHYFQNVVEEI